MKLKELTQEDIDGIVAAFTNQSFPNNEKGEFYYFNKEQTKDYIEAYVKGYFHSGYLYCTEGKEAYCVLRRNRELLKMRDIIYFSIQSIKILGFSLMHRLSKIEDSKELPIEEAYALKNIPFIFIGMMVVKEEYQGQGYFRKMLEEVFEMARKENRCVILNTDTESKVKKYEHMGFKLVRARFLEENNYRYDMKWEGGQDM